MTDRELLEMAAKAAGYGLPGPDDHDEIGRQELDGLWVKFPWGWGWWRPLAHDGDALRLACDLGLNVYPIARTASGAACSAAGSASEGRLSEVSDPSQDTRAATRRAIVLAAAEIGKAVQKPLAP